VAAAAAEPPRAPPDALHVSALDEAGDRHEQHGEGDRGDETTHGIVLPRLAEDYAFGVSAGFFGGKTRTTIQVTLAARPMMSAMKAAKRIRPRTSFIRKLG
jgi:hypothetical protein